MKYAMNVAFLCCFLSGIAAQEVSLVRNDSACKVDVLVDGRLFTSYLYSPEREKPFLYPIMASNGSVVTRSFPLAKKAGERTDHPHQVGLWFNYGNVNDLDFWNNSYAIPADKKYQYGSILNTSIVHAYSDRNTATLVVRMNWVDHAGKVLMVEDTRYVFTAWPHARQIDRYTTLTASGPVVFKDNKEGLVAVRVAREFEMPSNEPADFTDANGNVTHVAVMDNTGATGMYTGSNGKKGDAVWGTRNKWVILSARKDNEQISLAFFDHPSNPGYPAHAHARGYGLFALNNLGQNVFDPNEPVSEYKLKTGESMTFRHRFYILTGAELLPAEANKIFTAFSKEK